MPTRQDGPVPPATGGPRYHALDNLRAAMMFLGIVLHGVLSYTTLPTEGMWGIKDARRSVFFDLAVLYIHAFRMPVFFVLAGLFGALLYERRGAAGYTAHRAGRLLVPLAVGLIVLYPLNAAAFTFAKNAVRWGVGSAVERQRLPPLVPWDTTHLWFLYFLVIFSACAAVTSALCERLSRTASGRAASVVFRRALASPWRAVIFAVPTVPGLLTMRAGVLGTSHAYVPPAGVLLVYGYFFAVGWLLYAHRDLLPGLARGARTQVAATVPLLFAMAAALSHVVTAEAAGGTSFPALAAVAVTGALLAWLMVFGLTGLFLRYDGHRESAVGRYLADASYWVYLVHLPVVALLAGLLAPWPVSPFVKAALVCGVTTLVTVWTYDRFVRATPIGAVLNGRRYPRAWPRRNVNLGAAEPQQT